MLGRRQLATLALAGTATLLTTTACNRGSSATGSATGGGKQLTVAIIAKGFSHQYWQAVKKGAQDQAAKQNVTMTFEAPATEADVEGQVEMLTNALARNPDAIALAALDSRAVKPLLEQAKAAGIPVIAFDSGVDSDIPVTTASTDNVKAAEEDAKHLSEALGGKGKVAMIIHDQTSLTGVQRRDGFTAWMTKNSPGIELLTPQYANDANLATDLANTLFSANPDLAGIYGSNEGAAVGIVKAVAESGRTGLQIVGFDSGRDQVAAIKDGTMLGSVSQNPIGIGEQTIIAAVKAVKGESQPKTVDTGFYWYDKTNVTDPKVAAVLYD